MALPIRQFLDIHGPSPSESNKSEGLVSHRNSITRSKRACEVNSNDAKITECDQENSCRKVRVSIRTRSDLYLV